MRAMIVDDEQPAIDMLKVLLDADGRIDVTGTYRKPLDALAAVTAAKPDVVFLDIQMPLMNGLELAELLLAAHEELEIVFVTAYDRYALDAFKASAIDYLLKPIDETGLERSLSRLFRRKQGAVRAEPQQPQAVNLICFGGFAIACDLPDSPFVKWRTTKAQELMAYLCMKRGQEVSKWQIMDDLWPNSLQEQSHSHLHTTIYQIRKTLTAHRVPARLLFRNSHYSLEAGGLVSDMEQFAKMYEACADIGDANIADCERCLDLYAGDLFGTWDYVWSLQAREMYQQQFATLTKRVSRYYLQTERAQPALQRLLRLIDRQPLDEAAYDILLRIDIAMNNRAAFIGHYQKLEQALRAELGVEPNDGIRQLWEQWETTNRP
ncbi:response regulator [Paenibacillus cymbidii]|uniref:response regulator n=1 Tax=Paenibacillus cymbidii TaxID=1639034 RepID=UPI0014369268|nr:response regulator [Paenibacillus cymbidii]